MKLVTKPCIFHWDKSGRLIRVEIVFDENAETEFTSEEIIHYCLELGQLKEVGKMNFQDAIMYVLLKLKVLRETYDGYELFLED